MIRQVAALQRLAGLPVDGPAAVLRVRASTGFCGTSGCLPCCWPARARRCSGGGSVRAVLSRAFVARRGAAVGAAVPDHRLVGGNRARGTRPWRRGSSRLASAGAGGAAGARAARGCGFVAADRARRGGRRFPRGGHAGRDLLRARAGDPAAGDFAEPRDWCRYASVGRYSSGRVEVREPGAAARRGRDGDLRRFDLARPRRSAPSIGPSASVLFVDSSTAAEFAPSSGAAGSCGGGPRRVFDRRRRRLVGGASVEAGGDLDRAGRAASGAARLVPASVSLFGVVPRRVVSLRTSADAKVLTGPPAAPGRSRTRCGMAAPPGLGIAPPYPSAACRGELA